MVDQSHPHDPPPADRKPYEPPRLQAMGSLVELTQAAAGNFEDNSQINGSVM